MITNLAFGQTAAATASPVALMEKSFDFGKIRQGKPVTHDFSVVNTGSTPLQIRDVQASCGCTTPEWSSKPIAPGDSAIIKIGYNAEAPGLFNKPVTVLFIGQSAQTITITGDVYPVPATSVPLHSSVTLLKAKNR